MNRRPWPDVRAYLDAFASESLVGYVAALGTLVRDAAGEPVCVEADGSATFRFRSDRRDVAVRCFTHEQHERVARYATVAEYGRYVMNGALARVRFVARGVRIDGAWYPVVASDWHDAPDLRAEIVARLGDRDAMLRLARDFRESARSLDVLGIAHGDLQTATIVRAKGRLRFVPGDAAFVPGLAGATQLVTGHTDYQHRDRPFAPLDARIDRFSTLVIFTALVALAHDASLWDRYDNGANVLFCAEDFRSEGTSPLFGELLRDDATRDLARALRQACRVPVEQVAALETIVDASLQPASVVATLVSAEPAVSARPSDEAAIATVARASNDDNAYVRPKRRDLFRRFGRLATID